MIIFEIRLEKLSQLPFIEHDCSIQAFPPNGTRQPLDKWVLPRRSRGDQLLLDAHALDPLHEERSVDRIAIPQQILGCCVVGKRMDDLLCGPSGRGSVRNVEMNDLAPFMVHDDQHVEQTVSPSQNSIHVHHV